MVFRFPDTPAVSFPAGDCGIQVCCVPRRAGLPRVLDAVRRASGQGAAAHFPAELLRRDRESFQGIAPASAVRYRQPVRAVPEGAQGESLLSLWFLLDSSSYTLCLFLWTGSALLHLLHVVPSGRFCQLVREECSGGRCIGLAHGAQGRAPQVQSAARVLLRFQHAGVRVRGHRPDQHQEPTHHAVWGRQAHWQPLPGRQWRASCFSLHARHSDQGSRGPRDRSRARRDAAREPLPAKGLLRHAERGRWRQARRVDDGAGARHVSGAPDPPARADHGQGGEGPEPSRAQPGDRRHVRPQDHLRCAGTRPRLEQHGVFGQERELPAAGRLLLFLSCSRPTGVLTGGANNMCVSVGR